MANPEYVTDLIDDVLASQYNNLVDFARRDMLDYKIVVTISSNNITLALKHADDTNPSVADPLIFKIGDSWRTLATSLSVTVNAAVNTFNAGGAELATVEADYFVYISWRTASSAIVLGFSRIPWANVYSEFSGTATNEKYAAFSTAPASTDNVVVIGRIAATLSAGAGYTWTSTSQSAPTTVNTIQKPIYKTRVLNWLPSWTNVTLGNGTQTAKYQIFFDKLSTHVELVFGSTTTIDGTGVTHTMPLAKSGYGGTLGAVNGLIRFQDIGTATYLGVVMFNGASALLRVQGVGATYATPTDISATVPFTWVTTDEIYSDATYFVN